MVSLIRLIASILSFYMYVGVQSYRCPSLILQEKLAFRSNTLRQLSVHISRTNAVYTR